MLKRTALVVALLLAVASCNDDECEDSTDCGDGTVCAYFSSGNRCLFPCNPSQDDCPEGLQCLAKGSSCDSCDDIVYVCDTN